MKKRESKDSVQQAYQQTAEVKMRACSQSSICKNQRDHAYSCRMYDGNRVNLSFPDGTDAIVGGELGLCGVTRLFSPEHVVCFPQNCMSRVETITMPDTVKVIGPKTFEHCRKLKSVKLSQKLEKIYLNAFLNCESLKTITLPKSLKEVECWAFGNCELDDVYYDGTIFDLDKVEIHGFKSIKRLHCTDCTLDFTQKKYIQELKFEGTVESWKETMGDHWLNRRSAKIVCFDGEILNP